MKNLIGRKIRGFEFKDGPGFTTEMKKYVGEIGEIIKPPFTQHEINIRVKFSNNDSYWYPAKEALSHLVEDEIDEKEIQKNLTEIFNKIKDYGI